MQINARPKNNAAGERLRATGGEGRAARLWRQVVRCRHLYLLILPAVAAVFIFHYIPIYGIVIAFKDYRTSRGIMGSEWVGLKHFINFIQYPYFKRIMWNTLWISLVSLMTFPASIIFALMLNEMKNQKLKKTCQMITYAPYFVSTVVLCSMTILFLNREGLLNIIIEFLGGEKKDFLAEPAAFAFIYAITGLWQGLGWGTIIYLATLSAVSPELIEAAKLDGANRMQVIWHVDLPHLKPTIITLFILQMGSLLPVGFEKTFLLQNSLDLEASNVIATYVYDVGLKSQQFSYSTAVGLFNSVINIIMILLANAASKKITETSLW